MLIKSNCVLGVLLGLCRCITFVCISSFFSFYTCAERISVVTEYLPPFQIKKSDGSLGGYATEVIKELFALTHDEAKIELFPWARGYSKALKEKNVLIYSIAHTQERHSMFHWIGSLRYERFYFWGLKSKFSQHYTNLQQIKGISIASPNGYNSELYLTEHGFTNIYRVVNSAQQVQMLYKHRVDMVLANKLIIESQAKELGFSTDDLFPLFEAFELSNSLDIAFSLGSEQAIVKRFQNAFQQIKDSGKLAQIQKKWAIVDDASTLANF